MFVLAIDWYFFLFFSILGASIMLAELAMEAGLPNGVLNIVHGTNVYSLLSSLAVQSLYISPSYCPEGRPSNDGDVKLFSNKFTIFCVYDISLMQHFFFCLSFLIPFDDCFWRHKLAMFWFFDGTNFWLCRIGFLSMLHFCGRILLMLSVMMKILELFHLLVLIQ